MMEEAVWTNLLSQFGETVSHTKFDLTDSGDAYGGISAKTTTDGYPKDIKAFIGEYDEKYEYKIEGKVEHGAVPMIVQSSAIDEDDTITHDSKIFRVVKVVKVFIKDNEKFQRLLLIKEG